MLPKFTPEIGAALAKILADVGGAFAVDNPVQQGIAQTLQSGTTGLIKAQQFNRSNEELSSSLLSIVNQGQENVPLEGLREGDPVVRGSNRTLGDLGLTDPSASNINPFAALALGSQEVEQTIRTRQQERFRVERVLERETDFKRRIEAVKLADKNKEDLEELKMKRAFLLDIERGGPQQRAANLASVKTSTKSTQAALDRKPSVEEAAAIRARQAADLEASTAGREARTAISERAFESAATPEEASELRTQQIAEAGSRATITAADAKVREDLNAAQLSLAQLKSQRTPAELASIQRTAIKQVEPGIMRQLRRRLGSDSEELKQISSFLKLLGSDELDEAGRRSTFASLVSLLTPEELEFFQIQISAAEEAVLGGSLASTGVTIGTVPPLVDDITALSLDAAQEESDFLNRR